VATEPAIEAGAMTVQAFVAEEHREVLSENKKEHKKKVKELNKKK